MALLYLQVYHKIGVDVPFVGLNGQKKKSFEKIGKIYFCLFFFVSGAELSNYRLQDLEISHMYSVCALVVPFDTLIDS